MKSCTHATGVLQVATPAGVRRFDDATVHLRSSGLAGSALNVFKRDRYGVATVVASFAPHLWQAATDTCTECKRVVELTPHTSLTKDERPAGRRGTALVKHARPARMATGEDFEAQDEALEVFA